jgi:Mn-dependent DtxR family transcriptional regulator
MSKKQYIPDQTDYQMLLLISMGGGRCWYLARTFQISKPAISQRMIKLQEIGLIMIRSDGKNRSTESKDYHLTDIANDILQSTNVLFQLRILGLKSST